MLCETTFELLVYWWAGDGEGGQVLLVQLLVSLKEYTISYFKKIGFNAFISIHSIFDIIVPQGFEFFHCLSSFISYKNTFMTWYVHIFTIEPCKHLFKLWNQTLRVLILCLVQAVPPF